MRSYNESPGVFVSPPSLHTMGNVQTLAQHQHQQHQQDQTPPPLRHIWIITGPAGCGKSSVASHLAKVLDLPYIEGDDFHPPQNVQKMSNGIPLTDDDRWDWLETLRNQAVNALESGSRGCVVTCSCLKRRYRDVIREAGREADDVVLRFVYLRASEELLVGRVRARVGHYMKGDDMVRSQFTALEEPDENERDVLSIDVSGSLQSVLGLAVERVWECMRAVER